MYLSVIIHIGPLPSWYLLVISYDYPCDVFLYIDSIIRGGFISHYYFLSSFFNIIIHKLIPHPPQMGFMGVRVSLPLLPPLVQKKILQISPPPLIFLFLEDLELGDCWGRGGKKVNFWTTSVGCKYVYIGPLTLVWLYLWTP